MAGWNKLTFFDVIPLPWNGDLKHLTGILRLHGFFWEAKVIQHGL